MNTYIVYQQPNTIEPTVIPAVDSQFIRGGLCKVLGGYCILARDEQAAINTFNFIVTQVSNSRHIKE